MTSPVHIAGRPVGPGHACYVVAEIGINHNGDLDIAKRLVDVAVDAGCDAVKIQKRQPQICVPPDQWDVARETPWGETMRYIDYKIEMEFDDAQYSQLKSHCGDSIDLFASVWDTPSLVFVDHYDPPCHKIPSAKLTDHELLDWTAAKAKRPVILSTGMSEAHEVEAAVRQLERHTDQIVLLHSVSSYPCPTEELNLKCVESLKKFGYPVGYSGHEPGLQTTIAAVALGACMVERHITLNRTMRGTDHAASLEPDGLRRLVRDIRVVEQAMGDGVKRLMPSERIAREKLRGNG